MSGPVLSVCCDHHHQGRAQSGEGFSGARKGIEESETRPFGGTLFEGIRTDIGYRCNELRGAWRRLGQR